MKETARILYVLKYLQEQSDKDHTKTVADIITYLESIGFSAHRKTIYNDIDTLQTFGIDIVCRKSRQNQYFIEKHTFALPELTLLVDAIQAAKFVSVKDSSAIIKKLSALTSVHQADTHQQLRAP